MQKKLNVFIEFALNIEDPSLFIVAIPKNRENTLVTALSNLDVSYDFYESLFTNTV